HELRKQKGHWQDYVSGAASDLTFLNEIAAKCYRNVKSAALARLVVRTNDTGRDKLSRLIVRYNPGKWAKFSAVGRSSGGGLRLHAGRQW
ncbi:MAG: hypothetical protein P8Z80_19815, partial [Pseudolabrys sp.]